MRAQSGAETKLFAHPATSGGLSSALPAAASLPFTALGAGRGAKERGCSSDSGPGGRGQWRSQKAGSSWEPPPGSTRRLSTSRSRHGRGRGSATFRLGRPACVEARSSDAALRGSPETARAARRAGLQAAALPSDGNCGPGRPGAGGSAGQRVGAGAHGRGAAAAGRTGAPVSGGSPPRGAAAHATSCSPW